MNIKLKGSRLEVEVSKCRGECNWLRLNDLLPSIKNKGSGIENLASLIEGEIYLELFLEKEGESCFPHPSKVDSLKNAETLLQNAASTNRDDMNTRMEVYLLLSKLHFFCADFSKALLDIEHSKIEAAKTQFVTLRALKLAAESYALKGFSLENTTQKDRKAGDLRKRILSCFETSVELAISYISELQKTINAKPRTSSTSINYLARDLKIGQLLEMSLERAPYLSLKKSVTDRRWDLDGIEWYRRIMTELSDKSMVDKIQQKLCRQLAEVLMRGMLESGYDFSSRAINSKAKSLRQYHLLAAVYDRSMDFANDDRYIWFQFGLALICDNRFARASKILQHCLSVEESEGKIHDENIVIELMLATQLQIEQHNDADTALELATRCVVISKDTWLAGRCNLLFAISLSARAQNEKSLDVKKATMSEAIKQYELTIELDPHDETAHFFCALEYALACDLKLAFERCQRSLEINIENPSAIMLMGLLFTAKKDYKSALELVINSLVDFPTHYGLLVLRLKLEAKYGRVEEALQTSKNLLYFWRKYTTVANTDFLCDEDSGNANATNGIESVKTNLKSQTGNSSKLNSKDALVPATPIFTAPLGISAPSYVSLATSTLDITDANSMMGQNTNLSDYGGASTVSDSMGILSSSTKSWVTFPAFRIQANIWLELAEFFLEVDRVGDVQACVEEVCNIYPNSHQALYLKGRLFLIRSEKWSVTDPLMAQRFRRDSRNCFQGSISLYPAHVPSITYLSRLYYQEGNLKMSEKMLRDAISIDPFHYKNWHELGRILAEQGRIEEANESFQTAGLLNFNTPIIPFTTIPRILRPCNT